MNPPVNNLRQLQVNLKVLRVEKGLSVIQLSNRARVSESDIHYYERGTKGPAIPNLFKICDALGASVSEVFQESL